MLWVACASLRGEQTLTSMSPVEIGLVTSRLIRGGRFLSVEKVLETLHVRHTFFHQFQAFFGAAGTYREKS